MPNRTIRVEVARRWQRTLSLRSLFSTRATLMGVREARRPPQPRISVGPYVLLRQPLRAPVSVQEGASRARPGVRRLFHLLHRDEFLHLTFVREFQPVAFDLKIDEFTFLFVMTSLRTLRTFVLCAKSSAAFALTQKRRGTPRVRREDLAACCGTFEGKAISVENDLVQTRLVYPYRHCHSYRMSGQFSSLVEPSL